MDLKGLAKNKLVTCDSNFGMCKSFHTFFKLTSNKSRRIKKNSKLIEVQKNVIWISKRAYLKSLIQILLML